MTYSDRPSPEAFLRLAAQEGRGRLKIFLGAAPGVGKTWEMLMDGHHRREAGVDVVVGIVETHGRRDTEAIVNGHDIIKRRVSDHQGVRYSEMDVDAILQRHPALVLVDELAHSNAPGSRHPKRYQDVEELLDAGIDVYSTLNIQHVESLNDVVASITHIRVRETVPDSVLENAELEVVDLPPDELIERLRDGKVYIPQEASRALAHFFSKSNLTALRELALRRAAQAVDAQMLEHVRSHALAGNFAVGERIIVAVSELPAAVEFVRAAKRLADALKAPWTAVHIETRRSLNLSDMDRQQLSDTLALASRLGASTATVPAATVIDGLRLFAQDARATQIVMGKSRRPWWFTMLHGSIVDQLVRANGDVAVHVVPSDSPKQADHDRSSLLVGSWGKRSHYIWSFVMVAGMAVLGRSLIELIDLHNISLLFLIPVMAAAASFGLRAGLFAGFISSLAYNFVFLPPTGSLTVNNPENIISIFVLLGVAIVTSQFAARAREQANLAQKSARQNAALASFSRQLTAAPDQDGLMQAICFEVGRLLDVRAVFLLPSADGPTLRAAVPPDDVLEPIERAAAQWAIDNGLPAGRGSSTLTSSEWLFHPLATTGCVIGVLGISRNDALDPIRSDQLPLLMSLLDQAAIALDRMRLEEAALHARHVEERDRLRAALLSSVSHDLRTPLTMILSAAQAIRRGPLDGVAGAQAFAGTIEAEALRLNRFVSNLLDMVRVEAGALPMRAEATELFDAAASAAHDCRASLTGHEILIDIPSALPFVRLDPILLHHCLINLLDNAGRYADAGTPIIIRANRTADGIILSVIDQGPGIAIGDEKRVFEAFTRIDGNDRAKHGTGLGLAIVKGFAEAMGLTVEAGNHDDPHGAQLTIHIPSALIVDDLMNEKLL